MARPKYSARRDSNDSIIKEALDALSDEDLLFIAVDISTKGGMIDRIIYVGPLAIGIEVKTSEAMKKKDSSLTDGEKKFPGPIFVVSSSEYLKWLLRSFVGQGKLFLIELAKRIDLTKEQKFVIITKHTRPDSTLRAALLDSLQ